MKKFMNSWSLLSLLITVGFIAPPLSFPVLTRSLAAASFFVSDVGEAAGTVAQASANITAMMTQVITTSATTSMFLIEEFWHGIDLDNVTIITEQGRIGVDDPFLLKDFANTTGASLRNLPEPYRTELVVSLMSLSISAPLIEWSRQTLTEGFIYNDVFVSGRLWQNGLFIIEWKLLRVDALASWANPLWSISAFALGDESATVLARLRVLSSQAWKDVPPLPAIPEQPTMSMLAYLWHRFQRVCRQASLLGTSLARLFGL